MWNTKYVSQYCFSRNRRRCPHLAMKPYIRRAIALIHDKFQGVMDLLSHRLGPVTAFRWCGILHSSQSISYLGPLYFSMWTESMRKFQGLPLQHLEEQQQRHSPQFTSVHRNLREVLMNKKGSFRRRPKVCFLCQEFDHTGRPLHHIAPQSSVTYHINISSGGFRNWMFAAVSLKAFIPTHHLFFRCLNRSPSRSSSCRASVCRRQEASHQLGIQGGDSGNISIGRSSLCRSWSSLTTLQWSRT